MGVVTACMGTILALCAASNAALAGPSKAGLWQQTGYRIDTDGTRTPCELGQCVTLPDGKDIDKVCAAADSLATFARDHLEQFAAIAKMQGVSCTVNDKDSATGWDRELACNLVTLRQNITQPNDAHLSYETIIDGRPPGAPPVTSRFGASLVWIGDDCTGAGSAILPRDWSQRPVTPP